MGNKALDKVFGKPRMNIVLGLVAVFILAGSFMALANTELNKASTDTFTVDSTEYDWETAFSTFELTTRDDKEGILLSTLVQDAGIPNPETKEYTITGADGYEKTVQWEDMQNGILTKTDKMVFFPDLPKQLYVKDVVTITIE